MRKKLLLVLMISALAFGIGHFPSCADNESKKKNELYRHLEIFTDALSLVENEYVQAPADKDLIYGAIRGMLASLDPYSEFLNPQQYEELKTDTEGRFGGLGIEITLKDGLLTVITPIEDTPAWRAGILPGDRIIKIEGELTKDITTTEAVKKLRGKPGSEVIITIFREGPPKFFDLKIKREVIKIKDIKISRILEDNIGYVRLSEFRENSSKDIEEAINGLSKIGMDSLILDLRNNPGGLLDVAVSIAGKFIPSGKKIVSIKGRLPGQNGEFESRGGKYLDIPLAVLVNEGSASGSEIVAGALKDHRRAVIIGSKTFGKGSVQSVLRLSDGSALKLTTSSYFTPSGKSIHNIGIIPDVQAGVFMTNPLPQDKLDMQAVFEGLQDAGPNPPNKDGAAKKEEAFEYKNDNQILRAIDVIKGIKVFKGI